MDRLLTYLETQANRDKVVAVIERFTLIGGTLMVAIVITAIYFK